MIEHGLELITDYIEDFYENMDFLEMIDQLQRFSYENKGLFDIVSAMIMTEIGDEDMYNLKIKESQEERTTRKDIGYYIDERGIKRWGIVPTQQQNLNNKVCPPKAWRII
jgi:Ni,Fe-hydrogenase I large subunit